ncbi:MAG: hypothetical protein ACR2G1_09520 [Rubrobacteraceae bacterium]
MTDIDYTGLDWGRAIIVGTALRDGLIPTVANETLNAKETAQRLNLDERATHIMLSTLAEMGLLDETPEGFRLREEHRGPLLDEEDDKYVGGSVIHRFELITTWTNLPEILKTGLPAEDTSELRGNRHVHPRDAPHGSPRRRGCRR